MVSEPWKIIHKVGSKTVLMQLFYYGQKDSVCRYQVKVCGEHESNQGGPIGGSRDQIWPPEDLRGPQKGHFGPKRALLGPPGAQKGPDTRSKCVVSMSPTQTGQWGAVGTKSGPPGPSEDLRGPQKGHSGPK